MQASTYDRWTFRQCRHAEGGACSFTFVFDSRKGPGTDFVAVWHARRDGPECNVFNVGPIGWSPRGPPRSSADRRSARSRSDSSRRRTRCAGTCDRSGSSSTTPRRIEAGSKPPRNAARAASPVRSFCGGRSGSPEDVMRGVAGGTILGVPLLYTQEIWLHGRSVASIVILAGLLAEVRRERGPPPSSGSARDGSCGPPRMRSLGWASPSCSQPPAHPAGPHRRRDLEENGSASSPSPRSR